MQLFYKAFLFSVTLLFSSQMAIAQLDTIPTSIDPALLEIYKSKFPKEYTIAGIEVKGTKAFDENLLISISGLAIGDKVQLPGSDAFGKAINKLWKQNLIADVKVYITKVVDRDIYILLDVTERPRLAEFIFEGVKKGEKDDLKEKVGLARDRVVTDNMKLSAVEVIQKFYTDKGYRNVSVEMKEENTNAINNGVILTFFIAKGKKVRVSSLNFTNNEEVAEAKLKKQMKGTKEMSRFTLFPAKVESPYGDSSKKLTFIEYINDFGFLSLSKTKEILDPYIRFKLFSGAKFSEKKYLEDKEKVLDYYYSQGFRDATIVADTQFYDTKGNLNVDIKVNEGNKYYFGNIA